MLLKRACRSSLVVDKHRTQVSSMLQEKSWPRRDRKRSGRELLVSVAAKPAWRAIHDSSCFVWLNIELDCRFFFHNIPWFLSQTPSWWFPNETRNNNFAIYNIFNNFLLLAIANSSRIQVVASIRCDTCNLRVVAANFLRRFRRESTIRLRAAKARIAFTSQWKDRQSRSRWRLQSGASNVKRHRNKVRLKLASLPINNHCRLAENTKIMIL